MFCNQLVTNHANYQRADKLRFADYNIGEAQYIAAQNLILTLAAQGKLPTELAELRQFLAPILCHSPKEQDEFDTHFNQWLNQFPQTKILLSPQPKTSPKTQNAPKTKTTIKIEDSLSDVKTKATKSNIFSDVKSKPNTQITHEIKTTLKTGSSPLSDTKSKLPTRKKGNILWKLLFIAIAMVFISSIFVYWSDITHFLKGDETTQPIQLDNDKITHTIQPDTDEIVQPTQLDSNEITQPIQSDSDVVTQPTQPDNNEISQPKQDRTIVQPDNSEIEPEIQPVSPFFWDRLSLFQDFWDKLSPFQVRFTLLSPFLVLLLWLLWWQYRARLFLARQSTTVLPEIKSLFVKGTDNKFFQSVSLARTAQQLRQHISIPANLLDIIATVEKTTQSGGWFTPVTGTIKTRPEYLALIDRTTFNDHQTQLINSLINQLVDDDVLVTRYYFDTVPRRFYPEKNQQAPFTLTELAQHYPEHRLMVFSDGNGLVNPITCKVVNWIEQFSVWTQRALFTLETADQWGYREQLLKEANFLILPANETGLKGLVERINTGTWQPYSKPSDSFSKEFPEYLQERPRRWLEHHAPDAPVLTELLKQVRDFLGEAGYYWFSACAVYPELRWHLTLYLGCNLEATDGNQLWTNDRLVKLARLPWFRYGYMPNWLREQLIKNLLLPQKDKIRATLQTLLSKTSDKPLSDFKLEIATPKRKFSVLRQWVFSKWIKLNPKIRLQDYVFVTFMADYLDVRIPKTLIKQKTFWSYIIEVWHTFYSKIKSNILKFGIITTSVFLFAFILPSFFNWLTSLFLSVQNFFNLLIYPPLPFYQIYQKMFTLILFITVIVFVIYVLQISFNRFYPFVHSFNRKLATNLSVGLTLAISLIFQGYLGMGDIEDASLDLAMQAQNEIPSITEKKIPSFAFLDIDNQTYKVWGYPLLAPRDKIKELIDVAVKEKARLIVVDIDLSQKTLTDDWQQEGVQHKSDKVLYDYLANYKNYCQGKTCPPIILDRAFRPLPDLLAQGVRPIHEPRIGFLETAVADSAPYIQWASPLFQQSSYDGAIRRWKLWESICTTEEKPDIIPSTPLLAAAMIRLDTPQVAQDKINAELARFKQTVCGDVHIATAEFLKPIKITDELEFTGGVYSTFQQTFQQIMYHLPWKSPQSIVDKWVMRYSLRDSGSMGLPSKLLLTVFSAQPYLDSIGKRSKLENKIVLISSSYTGGDNLHSTPLGTMPGGLVIINALHSLLQYGEIQPSSNWYKLLWLTLLIIAVTFIFDFFKNSFFAILISGIIVIILIPVTVYLFVDSFWISFVLPLLAVHVSQVMADYQQLKMWRQDLEKEVKQSLAKQFDSTKLARKIAKEIEMLLIKEFEEIAIKDLSDRLSDMSFLNIKTKIKQKKQLSSTKEESENNSDVVNKRQVEAIAYDTKSYPEKENHEAQIKTDGIDGLINQMPPQVTIPTEMTETSEPLPKKKRLKPVSGFFQGVKSLFFATSKRWQSLSLFSHKLIINLSLGLGVAFMLLYFSDSPWLMETEDARMDWFMQINQKIVPSIRENNIPPVVMLDIDDKVYYDWGEPLIIPRKRLTNMIDAAIKAKARLVIVNLDVSQRTPIDGSQLHPDDQALKVYLKKYISECKSERDNFVCPTIILRRAFRTQSNSVPLLQTSFLDEVVAQGTPYIQWASTLFYPASDQVVRRWKLWQPACTTDKQPVVLPSIELLATSFIKESCNSQDVQNILQSFRPKNCDNDTTIFSMPMPTTFEICGLPINIKDRWNINQRIMYRMPWSDLVLDERDVPALTVLSAQPYAESPSQVKLETLTNNIVIIGGSYREGHDIYSTPIGDMPGSIIVANAIYSLLQPKSLELPPIVGLLITILFIVITTLLFNKFPSLWGKIVSSIFILFILLPLTMIFFYYGIWLIFVLPLIVVSVFQITFIRFRKLIE
ncbi:CHASE2 domain-containing protein [Thiotrichales bacterium HSG14]|nr:CHASE2 domain-containing protein [Thiotrichales bacterium HSG14]